MASGKDPNSFDRVWFKEAVELADITFDYDTYLLTAAKAKALKQAPSRLTTPPAVTPAPTQPSDTEAPPFTLEGSPASSATASASASLKELSVAWQGILKREQWNLFSLKVLTRLSYWESVRMSDGRVFRNADV